MDIEINIEENDDCSVVQIAGRIDATTADDLEDALLNLLDQGAVNIILDLENTVYISSAGLRVLILVKKQMYASGHFALCSASENVLQIIEMSGFNSVISVYEDIETAKANINED
ncbi:MAG: STAS domain-containing protein [Desulfobacteraceae bacterium]|nr:STAS domain-containing protein [Desulfobacteraceae bacterium]